MASNDPTPKKRKTRASASRQQPAQDEENYINVEKSGGFGGGLFPHKRGYKRFEQIMNAKIVPERGLNDQPDLDTANQLFQQFHTKIVHRRWLAVAQPPTHMNGAVIREFYANAWPADRTEFPKQSWVRGKFVRFDRHSINRYLATQLFEKFEDESRDDHNEYFSAGDYNEGDISNAICLPGRTFDVNASGEPLRYKRSYLKPLAQVWCVFLLSNIFPTEHTSDIVIDKAHILWSMMVGNLDFDLGAALSRELTMNVLIDAPKILVLPGLITGLCMHQGIELPSLKDVKLKQDISPTFIRRYCLGDATQPIEPQGEGQQPQVPAPRARGAQQQMNHQVQAMMEMMQLQHQE